MVYSEWVLNFDLFCFTKIFEEGVFLGLVDGTLICYVLFSAILCCLVLFTVINKLVKLS